ncbi:MAG: outer membrane beta-barrel protein [Verrucomicrobiota bacterium]
MRGRAGIASGNLLTYAIAGVTVGDLELEGCEDSLLDGGCAVENFTIYADEIEFGINAGVGVEYAVSPRSSIRAEYLYTVFPSIYSTTNESGEFTEPGDLSTDAHTLRLSWNYMLGAERGTATGEALQAASHDWSGPYVGGFAVGGMIVDDVLNPGGESNRAYNWAGGAGVSAGYDWQKGNFVYGVVADIAGGGFESDSYWAGDYRKEQDWDWLATIRGRAGIATGDLLLYGTAGIAIADMTIGVCDNGAEKRADCPSADLESIYDDTNIGLVAGVGAEYAISPKTTLFGEYQFVGFPHQSVKDPSFSGSSRRPFTDHTTAAHFLKVGINYALGSGREMSSDPTHDWSGFYAGAMIEPRLQYVSAGTYYSGATGSELTVPAGITLGHNWQTGNVVFGLEADYSTGADETEILYYDGTYQGVSDWHWQSTIRGRAGIATGDALLYATAGLAIADITAWSCDGSLECESNTDEDAISGIDDVLVGFVAGFGVEYAFNDNWSGVVEYRYTGFPSEYGEELDGNGYEFDFTNYTQGVKLGVNYAF